MSKQPLIDRLDDAISRILTDPAGNAGQSAAGDASLDELIHFAHDLRDLPSADFKRRLRADLERQISMSTKTVEFRPGFRTVTPFLLAPDAEYIEFLKTVFGAVETEHTETSPTTFHSELRIGDSMVMVGVGSGRSMPTALHVYVPDVDEVFQRALKAGASQLSEIVESHGDRFGCVQDAVGNHFYIATYLGQHYVHGNLNAVTPFFHPKGSARFIDFLKRAFGAEEVLRVDSPAGDVLHAKIRIGESVIEVSEPHDWWQPMPTMLYLYVPDADALYERALRAGATSIHGPKDQPYGDRNAGVTDEWGNQWYVATPL